MEKITPIHYQEKAFVTYLRAGLYIFPALTAFLISSVFILPSIERCWIQSELYSSRAWWVMQTANDIFDHGTIIIVSCIALLIVLESRVPPWPRFRQPVVSGFVILVNTAIMAGLLAEATAAMLAMSVLLKK